MGWTGVVGGLLALSLACNAYLLFKLKTLKKQRPAHHTMELQDFLADVRNGIGMLAVARIDPDMVVLRSPREAR